MLLIGDVLISNDIIEKRFMCNLDACKGACCWEGDLGAPLEEEEVAVLDNIYEDVKPLLLKEGQAVIEKIGTHTYDAKRKEYATPLVDGGPCVFMIYDNDGIAQCGIEAAYNKGLTDFRKPISCHLYPVRIKKIKEMGMEGLNYDKWDICSAACELGEHHQMPVYQFVKDALIRKYGPEFYEELDAAAKHVK
jgi:hypothetical protein